MPQPDISAIVVTLNEGQQLIRTVEHLEAALPGRREIIVVDDGSTDGSLDFMRHGREGVIVLRTDQIGVARARNCGARSARAGPDAATQGARKRCMSRSANTRLS